MVTAVVDGKVKVWDGKKWVDVVLDFKGSFKKIKDLVEEYKAFLPKTFWDKMNEIFRDQASVPCYVKEAIALWFKRIKE